MAPPCDPFTQTETYASLFLLAPAPPTLPLCKSLSPVVLMAAVAS